HSENCFGQSIFMLLVVSGEGALKRRRHGRAPTPVIGPLTTLASGRRTSGLSFGASAAIAVGRVARSGVILPIDDALMTPSSAGRSASKGRHRVASRSARELAQSPRAESRCPTRSSRALACAHKARDTAGKKPLDPAPHFFRLFTVFADRSHHDLFDVSGE